MKRSLVVGVDGTEESIAALRTARDLARLADLGIVAVHVRHVPLMAGLSMMSLGAEVVALDDVEQQTRAGVTSLLRDTGLDWDFVVRSGDPARELLAVADHLSAWMIVVGGRRHSAPVSAILHSVAASLVHHFRGSVLVVRGEGDSDCLKPSTRAAVGTPLGGPRDRALERVREGGPTLASTPNGGARSS